MALNNELLDYLHDATLCGAKVTYSEGERSIFFDVTLHEESEVPDSLVGDHRIVAEDITLVRSTVHGSVIGDESIHTFSYDVSGEFNDMLDSQKTSGLRNPSITFSIESGYSFWEVACESISISTQPNNAIQTDHPADGR